MTYAEKTLDFLSKGDLTSAEENFTQALKNDSDEMIYSLAEELYSLGFSEMAQKAYQHLLELYPDEDSLKTPLAEIEISEGNDDKALAILSQITPDSDAYLEALLQRSAPYSHFIGVPI